MSFRLYDPDFNTTIKMDKQTATAAEIKQKVGRRAGSWIHPKNRLMVQRYRVTSFPVYKEYSDTDTIDLSNCPILRIDLVYT